MCAKILFALFPAFLLLASDVASVQGVDRYTPKQLEALRIRVGRTYWVVAIEGKTPTFLSEPSARASAIKVTDNSSFRTIELVTIRTTDPYYKVTFDSGAEAYIKADAFLEEFNARIVTVDPLAEEKRKAAEAKERERERVAWIRKQPWSPQVKDAALQGRAVIGMNTREVKGVKGEPERVIKIKGDHHTAKEQWMYGDGSVLVFVSGQLTEIEFLKTGDN